MENSYLKYRGKCKELAQAEIITNPNLRLVRGVYYCWSWGKQQHWWCEDPEGTIIDPSCKQFPSKGTGEYEEFDGTCYCDQCGKVGLEEDFKFESNYAFCCAKCLMYFVGIY